MIGGGSGHAVFVDVLSQGRFSEANHRHCEVPQWPLNHIRWIGGSSIDFLIGLTAHCMRGQPAIPVFFRSGLRATFFLRTKKEGKDVPGASPPGPPGGLPAIFRGKPAVARLPESTIKKGCGPGVWGWLHFFGSAPTPTPGAQSPLVVWTSVQEKTAMPVFLKENRPKARGSGGKAPGVSLHPFSTRRKDVAAQAKPFQ